MMKKMCRLIAVAVAALMCVGLFGCDYLKNDDEPVLIDSGSRKDGSFVMVSDTTALFSVHYYDLYEEKSGADRESCTKSGIRLVGTKGIEYCYWEGLADSCAGMRIESLGDSTVLFMGRNGDEWFEYFVWKIEAEPIEKNAKWVNGRLPITLDAVFMRQWKEGKFLFKYYEKFALLDTTENTITQVTKEEAGWPDGVEDAQYFGDDLMTLHFVSENRCGFAILKDLADTVAVHREDSCSIRTSVLAFNGKFIYRMNYDSQSDGDMIFSTDSSWQISEKPVAKYYVQYFKPLDRE